MYTLTLFPPSPWLHTQLSSVLTFTTRSWKKTRRKVWCTGTTSLHALLTWGEAGPRACSVSWAAGTRTERRGFVQQRTPTSLPDRSSFSRSRIIHPFSSSGPRLRQVKQMNARLHKICCCISCGFGSLLPRCSQQALLSSQARGEEEEEGGEAASGAVLRLRATEPASPPRNRRKKQFILTNSESLQRGWPFLSKLVYHAEAHTLERRGRVPAVKRYTRHSRREMISNAEEPGCKRLSAYPPGILAAGKHDAC